MNTEEKRKRQCAKAASNIVNRHNPKTARFWEWTGESMTRLSIKVGQPLEWTEGGPHDEGYSYTHHRYEFDGEVLTCETTTKAKDCDGRIWNSTHHECEYSRLSSRFNEYNGHMMPAWLNIGESHRDHSAESMGY